VYQKPLRWIELLDDLSSVEFLLAVTVAGREFYFSTRPLTVPTETGSIVYRGGLAAKWTDALNLFNYSPTLLAIPLEIIFPVDVAALVARGFNLWRGVGELSLWVEGRTYEERIVLMRGSMVEPTYGALNEPVKFSLEANGFQDTSLVLDQTQRVIEGVTWNPPPVAVPQVVLSEGVYYPIVFGTPGRYQDAEGVAQFAPATPAPVVEVVGPLEIKIVIAGHAVEAANVSIWNNTKSLGYGPKPITLEVDNLGQTVSTVNLDYSIFPYDPGDELLIIWNQDGGGLWNDTRTQARTGAGELITYFLRLSTLGIDTGVWRSIASELDQQFKFSGYVNEPCSAWEYIEDNFLPLLPVSVFATGEGISAAFWRRQATAADVVGTVSTGGGVARVGPITYEKQEILNDIRIDYALSLTDRSYRRTSGVIGDREAPAGEGLFSSSFSRASFLAFGAHAGDLSSDVIYETATATNVLEWMHRAHAFPHRVVSYDVPIRLGFLRRGNLVLLQDPEVHLVDRVCFVRNVAWIDGRPRLTLVLVEDPPRDDRGL
jgi:hypothetical protein